MATQCKAAQKRCGEICDVEANMADIAFSSSCDGSTAPMRFDRNAVGRSAMRDVIGGGGLLASADLSQR